MQPQKRSWLYGGLAHPPSVVLARGRPVVAPVRKRLPPGSKLLVAGDDHAWGVSTFLRQLCRDTGVAFEDELDSDACIEAWAADHRLVEPVADQRPHMVMISLAPRDGLHDEVAGCLQAIATDGRAHGATLVWLRPPQSNDDSAPFRLLLDAAKIPSFHSEALELPQGADDQPSVRGYAGWAGALWRWIG